MRRKAVIAVLAMLGSLAAISGPVGAQDVPMCDGLPATIVGDAGNNRLIGTDGPDVIWAGPGRDRIFGGGGADVICGGPGSDLIKGEKGRDRLFGEDGRDRVIGGQGADYLDGGRGNDSVRGGFGDDTVIAGPGTDYADGWNGFDTCDIDRNDTHASCEAGDVSGADSFGGGSFDVDVDESWLLGEGLDTNGELRRGFLLEVYVNPVDPDATWNLAVDVLDAAGGTTTISGGMQGQLFDIFFLSLAGAPVSVEVTGLGPNDYWDISVLRPETLQQVSSGDGFSGFGNWVWKWRNPLPDVAMTFEVEPRRPGGSVSGAVVAIFPDKTASTILSYQNVTERTVFELTGASGANHFVVYGTLADWSIEIG